MNVKQSLKWASDELKKNKVSEPEKSAEFLLRQVLETTSCHSREGGNPVRNSAWTIANSDYKLTSNQEDGFRGYIERRTRHEPVWYITGKIEFYSLDLEVNENVLIPRPETEFLVEEVLGQSKNEKLKSKKILELGTGSGAITLALASKFRPEDDQPLAEKIFASDISKDALIVAKKNAKKLGLEKFIEFRQGDLFESWPQILGASKGKKFDIIVANLPYIPHEDMNTLALDIHHWEPRVALDGGKDGLEIYERLVSQAKDYLNPNAMMFFEIGIDQGDKLEKLVEKYLPHAKVKIQKDYGDIDRIAIISNIRNSC